MTDAERTIDRVLEDSLAGRNARDGAIGFVGADVPVDVLLASGRPFGHLPWRAAGGTPFADRWLESSFPFWARSILEQWHEGAFDALSVVVFSRSDDASQRLFYYVTELKRRGLLGGPATHVFDIALLPRESSVAHTAAAVRALAEALGVEPSALAGGIAKANDVRRALAGLEQARGANGSLYERLGRAALWSDASGWLDALAMPAAAGRGTRVILLGSVPPDDRLHRAVDATGACIVAEGHVHGLGRLGPAVAIDGESPERSLARHLMAHSTGPRAVLERGPWSVARVAAAGAAAALLWLTREDEGLAWQLPAQRRALAAAGVPTLVLPAARWQADDGALEAVGEFCRGLERATA